MEATKQTVTLVANDQKQDFEISHAERLLRMPNNGGWKLPEDSQFKFDENGIGVRKNKRRDIETEKQGDNNESDQSPKQN